MIRKSITSYSAIPTINTQLMMKQGLRTRLPASIPIMKRIYIPAQSRG